MQTLQSCSVTMEYQPRCSMTCQLKPNWELMGSITESVPWADRTCNPPEVVDPALFGWDADTQSFVIASNVEPGHGYYVRQVDNSILTIECASAPTAPGKQVRPFVKLTPSWESVVSLNAGNHHQELAFGMHPSASAGFDILLDSPYPPVPASMDGISKAAWVVEDPAFSLLHKSFVGDSSHAVWELSVELSESGRLQWQNLPLTYRCLLWHDGQAAKIHNESSISLPEGRHDLRLVLDAFAALPKQTELLSNYPNPCNPETWIPYRLSGDGDVVLIIYDVSGRELRRFNLHDQFAGEYQDKAHAIYWDGQNQVGEAVSSGVYFYSLQTAEAFQTRKLVIIR